MFLIQVRPHQGVDLLVRLDGVAGDAGHLDAASEQGRRQFGGGAHLGGADGGEVGGMGQQNTPAADRRGEGAGQSPTRRQVSGVSRSEGTGSLRITGVALV